MVGGITPHSFAFLSVRAELATQRCLCQAGSALAFTGSADFEAPKDLVNKVGESLQTGNNLAEQVLLKVLSAVIYG